MLCQDQLEIQSDLSLPALKSEVSCCFVNEKKNVYIWYDIERNCVFV